MNDSRLPREPQASQNYMNNVLAHPEEPSSSTTVPGPAAQTTSFAIPSSGLRGPRPARRVPGNAGTSIRPTRKRYRRTRRGKGRKSTMGSWWLPSRIDAAVTRQFVLSQLLPDEIERLDRPVGFGDEELTERTYWDSIHDDAPRLFLILVDLGVPDQIFGVIDDGWDDAELPIALEDVDRLQLAPAKDERLDRKFFSRQFHYLLRPLEQGAHQVYDEQEVVPLEIIERPPLTPHKAHQVDKVRVPNAPNSILCRRRYQLGNGPGCVAPQEFLDAIQGMRGLQNEHIVSYWASYTYQGHGYILSTPASDFSLKSFLATTPATFKSLSKKARREMIINWILCLVDTMSYIHIRNRSHCLIKPSTILFDNRNHISFANSSSLTLSGLSQKPDKSSFDREWYDYAAPEQWYRPTGASSPPAVAPMMPSSSSPLDHNNVGLPRGAELSSSPNAMLSAPNPQLSPQQADIFSLGCIILELLSFLVKRSTGKFASFRSAKHKTGGRGGAVLDTSFHRHLGQVEAWMSNIARDAAHKVSDSEGGNAFRGVTPILHVVTGMLSANPYDRPSAIEVQQRIYQIVTEVCRIQEPHCVHQYSHELDYALGRMRIQNSGGPAPNHRQHQPSIAYEMPRIFPHSRNGSSDGHSRHSRSTLSSEADVEYNYSAPDRSSTRRARSPGVWSEESYFGGSEYNSASIYTAGS